MKYWVHINNKVLGPYEESELKDVEGFTSDTLLYPEDAVEGETEWKPASEVIEIEPNTNSDTKAEFTIPESINKTGAEKTIKESVDRLDKTLMGLKTTISKSAEMTSGEQNVIEKKLEELGKEMSAFRADMKEFLDQTKKLNEALVQKVETQPEPAIEPQTLPESQKEDTIKLSVKDDNVEDEKTEDKIENVIGKTEVKNDNEKGEMTVSLDEEDNVKTVESSTETLKHVKEDLKDTIMEAQQYPDVEEEEDSEKKRLEEEARKEKEKLEPGEAEVVDIKTQQSIVKDEDKDKLEEKPEGEEPKEDAEKPKEEEKEEPKEEKPEEEKPQDEEKSEEEKPETPVDEQDDDMKILEKTIEEVKEATLKEKGIDKEDEVVIEEEKKEDDEKEKDHSDRKEVIESLLTPEQEKKEDIDEEQKDDQNKTLSEMVLTDSTSVISDFIPDQNVEEKSSDELSKEEIQDLAESIVTKEDVNDAEEKSRIDLVSKGVDQSKVDHTMDPAKKRKKPKDIKTIPDEEQESVADAEEKEKELSQHTMDTIEDIEKKKPQEKAPEEEVEPKKEKPEVVEDDGTLVKPKSKYLLIILIVILLIVAGYFMGFGKFLKSSYGAKKQGQPIETIAPAVVTEEGVMMGETEGIDQTTMQDDGFMTSDDLVFPGEERMADEGQPIVEGVVATETIIEPTTASAPPSMEMTIENEVKNYKLPTGLTLQEMIISKHIKNKDKIAWQVQESVEDNIYSVFVRVPPDNVNQTFATVYSLNYNGLTKILTATNSEAKNLMEPATAIQ